MHDRGLDDSQRGEMNPMRLRSKRALLPCSALFFFFLLGGPSLANDPFQTPKGLESSVEFWIKVFTRYKRNQAAVHDTEDPSLIYDVVNLDGAGGPSSERVRWRRARRARERYARLFRTWSVSPPGRGTCRVKNAGSSGSSGSADTIYPRRPETSAPSRACRKSSGRGSSGPGAISAG